MIVIKITTNHLETKTKAITAIRMIVLLSLMMSKIHILMKIMRVRTERKRRRKKIKTKRKRKRVKRRGLGTIAAMIA